MEDAEIGTSVAKVRAEDKDEKVRVNEKSNQQQKIKRASDKNVDISTKY